MQDKIVFQIADKDRLAVQIASEKHPASGRRIVASTYVSLDEAIVARNQLNELIDQMEQDRR